MEKLLFLIAICVICVSGLTPTTCPETKSVAKFNLPRAFGLGIWYDLARYPNELQTPGKCSYHKGRRLKGNIKLKTFDGLESSADSFESSATLDAETGEVIFSISHGKPRTNVVIRSKPLVMEYDKYAIMYSCEYDQNKKANREYVWILTRSKEPTPEVLSAIDDYIIKSSSVIDESKLEWAEYSDGTCRFTKRT